MKTNSVKDLAVSTLTEQELDAKLSTDKVLEGVLADLKPCCYVTMTDKFMSGWGQAKGKINKLIFACDSMTQAQIVADNATCRSDQKYINIVQNKPYYNASRYYVQHKNASLYPAWYKKDYFRERN